MKFYDRLKGGVGSNGLCFGMSVVTEQFQSGMLDAAELLQTEFLDKGSSDTAFHKDLHIDNETLLDFVKFSHLYQYTGSCAHWKDPHLHHARLFAR